MRDLIARLIRAGPNLAQQLKNQIVLVHLRGKKHPMKLIKSNCTEQHHLLLSEYLLGFTKNLFFFPQKISIAQRAEII